MQRIAIAAATAAAAAVILAVPLVSAQDGEWGNIKGRIVWGPKDIPVQMPIAKVKEHADKAHCLAKGPVLDEQWVVNKKNRGLQWTFVWLINADPKDKKALPIHPSLKEVPSAAVEIDQPHCAFIPHAACMREGQVLVAKNSSPVTHNVKWTGAAVKNMGNVTLPAGAQFKIEGLEAQKLPMPVECNIHPWMNMRVGIFNHPYFALTDADGKFEIKNAPAGKYRAVIYNGAYLGGAKGRFGQEITITPKGVDLGEVEFAPPAE
jgi:hypothetical protein